MKIIVIVTQTVETRQWGLWSNKHQCWMHKTFCRNKGLIIRQAKILGFKIAGGAK